MLDADRLPRLLVERDVTTRRAFESHFAAPTTTTSLLRELELSGLRGRGGAAFPTAQKVRLVADQHARDKVVAVNAMEGEPGSHKDYALLWGNPHLVLDGAARLARAVGASRVVVCVARERTALIARLEAALAEHAGRAGRVTFDLRTPPGRYVAGEESALVHWLNDHESLPQYRPNRPHVARLKRAPVLVDNAETCANVALIGRFGASWFRRLGPSTHPGSTLVSLSGALDRPKVLEVALGTPLRTILRAGGVRENLRAVLLGGYGGSWLSASHLDVAYENDTLARVGASVGAGVIASVARDGCGLLETTRVVRWMAHESARQCGPCAFGLPALAEDLAEVVRGSVGARAALARLRDRADVIDGRGACHHPDGVVRLVRSALDVFGDDVAAHADGRGCEAGSRPRHYLSVPALEDEAALSWA